jgi:hypothetical protein
VHHVDVSSGQQVLNTGVRRGNAVFGGKLRRPPWHHVGNRDQLNPTNGGQALRV